MLASCTCYGYISVLGLRRKAALERRTAMSSVKVRRVVFLFYLKSVFFFSFPAWSRVVWKRLPGAASQPLSEVVAPPAIRARPRRERHLLTLAVTTRKRARPISRSGSLPTPCGVRARAVSNLSPVAFMRLQSIQTLSRRPLSLEHDPAQFLGARPAGAPAPQVHGHLPRHGHDGFLARAGGGPRRS